MARGLQTQVQKKLHRFFLDSSVIVWVLRGKKEVSDQINILEGDVCSGFVCLAELYEGVIRSGRQAKAEIELLEFFSNLSEIFGIDLPAAKIFGQIRAGLKYKGEVIEDIDIFIAAICLAHNLTLVTANPKHFSRIPDLKILAV